MAEWLGKTIGKVRIEKLLARGGMAEVYLGSHLMLERPVAIKLLHSHIEEEPLLLERFHREAKVVAGLRHPNIVQVFDYDTVDGHPYIVMEYFSGPTLATYLSHLHHRKKRIPADQVARLLKRLTSALEYAHNQGVIHRDVKPGNILLHNKTDNIPLDAPLPDNVEPIVTDFGLVRVMNAVTQTASGIISGTPAYMSPEQVRGDQADHRTDIYSLGVVLYEMLAGRVPFEADNTVTILHMHVHTPPPPIPGIPPQVQAVLDRALRKKPDERYQSIQEMARDYYRVTSVAAQPEPVRAPERVDPAPVVAPAKPAEPPRTNVEPPKPQLRPELQTPPQPRRSRVWMGVGLLSLVLIALVVFGASRLLAAGSGALAPPSTDTVSPVVPNTAVSPLPSEPPDIPESTGMVEVQAGTYTVGTTTFTDDYHIAPKEISLSTFWIDQYQTTNAEYEEYIAATGAPPPLLWPGEPRHPVRGVTWDQALAYCTWQKKRLPTEAEWEAAGRGPGPEPQLYPWGDDPTDGGNTLQLPDENTSEVGVQTFNVSPLQLYDMVGNVWEWVGEPYGDIEAGKKIVRGGRFSNAVDLAYRVAVAPDDMRYVQYAGFRCAADEVR
jgi:serine/threonine-protein kinase